MLEAAKKMGLKLLLGLAFLAVVLWFIDRKVHFLSRFSELGEVF